MIDAYEIGIQLMLQDDVSAGLAVINQGLAEVDRAIAATSANLSGLARTAETTQKAISVAVGGRAVVPVSPVDQKPIEADKQPGQGRPPQEQPVSAAAVAPERGGPPPIAAAEPEAPRSPVSSPPSTSEPGSERDWQRQSTVPNAPVRSAIGETAENGVPAATVQTDVAVTPVSAPTQASPRLVATTDVTRLPERADAPTQSDQRPRITTQDMRRSPALRTAPQVITASVNREQRSSASATRPEQVRQPIRSEPGSRRERAVAPWSGVEHAGPQADAMRSREVTAAPQSSDRRQSESTGGTVMLDGRLVGQWLSEHMGREASRPPASTSFFDPRQTPAWYVSGAV